MKDNDLLPLGWGDRHNQMSERDIQLGGMAATKFASKTMMTNAYRSNDGGDSDKTGADDYMTYKNSDQVREFYLKDYQKPGKGAVSDTCIHATTSSNNTTTMATASKSSSSSSKSSSTSNSTTTLPDFWTDRQKERDLQAKQMGVFSRHAQQQQQQQQKQHQASTIDPSQHNSNRMGTREIAEKEKGSVPTDPSSPSSSSSSSSLSPEVALVQIATQTLETMAKAFQNKHDVNIPIAERTAFATAMKQAMDALAKQSM